MSHSSKIIVCGLTFVLLFATASARAFGDKPYSRVVIFGDSLSDSGNHFLDTGEFSIRPFDPVPDASYLIGAFHFSNGRTWVERLARDLGVGFSAGPSLQWPGFFTNYAYATARARPLDEFDLSSQVNLFLEDFGGDAPQDALYAVWVGGNDLRDALDALLEDPTGATSQAIIAAAISAIADNLTALVEAGAHSFLVLNAPNVSLAPAVREQGPTAQLLALIFASSFNAALSGVLDQIELQPVEMTRMDAFSVLSLIAGSPGDFGLSEVEKPCLTFDVIFGAICSLPDEHMFWDAIHPTATTHEVFSVFAGQELESSP